MSPKREWSSKRVNVLCTYDIVVTCPLGPFGGTTVTFEAVNTYVSNCEYLDSVPPPPPPRGKSQAHVPLSPAYYISGAWDLPIAGCCSFLGSYGGEACCWSSCRVPPTRWCLYHHRLHPDAVTTVGCSLLRRRAP